MAARSAGSAGGSSCSRCSSRLEISTALTASKQRARIPRIVVSMSWSISAISSWSLIGLPMVTRVAAYAWAMRWADSHTPSPSKPTATRALFMSTSMSSKPWPSEPISSASLSS